MNDIKLPDPPEPDHYAKTDTDGTYIEAGPSEKGAVPFYSKDDVEEHAREAVRLNAAVPDGWKLVPVDATDEMVKVGDQKTWVFPSRECWAAMLSAAPAAPQPAPSLDDESDALTIAYLHGHGKGKDSVQPLLEEKDALLRQAMEALENLQSKTDDGMNGEFRICCATRPDEFHEHCETTDTIEAIRQNLGVKND